MCIILLFIADVSGFDHYDAFKFQVAVGVLLFLYTLTLIGM